MGTISPRDEKKQSIMEIIRQKDAKKLGLKYYFTGKPCPKGHTSKRYIGETCYVGS